MEVHSFFWGGHLVGETCDLKPTRIPMCFFFVVDGCLAPKLIIYVYKTYTDYVSKPDNIVPSLYSVHNIMCNIQHTLYIQNVQSMYVMAEEGKSVL